MNNNKKYLKNLADNWLLLVPTFGFLIMQLGILAVGFTALIEITNSITEGYAKVLSVIVVSFILMKLVMFVCSDDLGKSSELTVKIMTGELKRK